MIRRSDGPKTYWGSYQDYLVQICKKIPKKKFQRIRKNPKGIVWRKNMAEMEVVTDFQICSKKQRVQ